MVGFTNQLNAPKQLYSRKVGFFHIAKILEAITKHMIHTDMGQPDQGNLHPDLIIVEITQQHQDLWENDAVHDIISDAGETLVDSIKQ